MGGGGVTDPAEDTKGNDDPVDSEAAEEPEIRTDGGEVAAQNPGFGTNGIQSDLKKPPQPGIPPFTDRPDHG